MPSVERVYQGTRNGTEAVPYGFREKAFQPEGLSIPARRANKWRQFGQLPGELLHLFARRACIEVLKCSLVFAPLLQLNLLYQAFKMKPSHGCALWVGSNHNGTVVLSHATHG